MENRSSTCKNWKIMGFKHLLLSRLTTFYFKYTTELTIYLSKCRFLATLILFLFLTERKIKHNLKKLTNYTGNYFLINWITSLYGITWKLNVSGLLIMVIPYCYRNLYTILKTSRTFSTCSNTCLNAPYKQNIKVEKIRFWYYTCNV